MTLSVDTSRYYLYDVYMQRYTESQHTQSVANQAYAETFARTGDHGEAAMQAHVEATAHNAGVIAAYAEFEKINGHRHPQDPR